MLTVTKVVSRDQQLRSGRILRVGVATVGRMARAMDKELKDSDLTEHSTCAGGPLDVELQRVWRTLNVWLNVDKWPFPAYGSYIWTPVVWTVGPKSIGGRECIW